MSSSALPDFQALLGRYERPLIQYAHSFVNDLDAARDVVQETFITYVRALTKDREPGSEPPPTERQHLEGWLFTVTRYRALDYVRKQQRIVPMPFVATDEHCPSPGPSESAESRDEAIWLMKLVDELPPNQREVIRLKFQSDMSYEEIAAVTGLSSGNVGFLLHHGLKRLRTLAERRGKGRSQIG
jgi:RNA polymerase sigma-70 factor (ECF subfamily)